MAPRHPALVSSSSRSAPSSVAQTVPSHQLPPIVHAIGASIGSALAILAFYPFERIRVELQSQGERSINSTNKREAGERNGGNNDDKKNIIIEHIEFENENQADIVVNSCVEEHLGQEVRTIEESPSSSNSPTESFELVPAPSFGSVDVVESLETSSFGDDLSVLNLGKEEHDKDDVASQDLLRLAEESEPAKSASVARDFDVNQRSNRSSKSPISENTADHRKPPPSGETIIQCLLRLHNKQTLYKGASPVVTTLMISNAVFFYALQVTKRTLTTLQEDDHQLIGGKHRHSLQYLLRILLSSKMGNSLIASSLAGCINVFLTNPLWVASLRIMDHKGNQKRQNLFNVVHQIASDEGISRLWNGTKTSLLLVSNPIIQHFVYEQLRLWLLERHRKRAGPRRNISGGGGHRNGRKVNISFPASLSPVEAFIFGALAKTVATLVTYPLQLAQVLLRLQKKNDYSPQPHCANDSQLDKDHHRRGYEGTLDCLYKQFSRGGLPALFKGMNVKLLQTALTAAFTFLTYEQTLIKVARIYETFGYKNLG